MRALWHMFSPSPSGDVAQHILRIQKTREDANIKLTDAISDVLGLTGRAILDALLVGEADPERRRGPGGRSN